MKVGLDLQSPTVPFNNMAVHIITANLGVTGKCGYHGLPMMCRYAQMTTAVYGHEIGWCNGMPQMVVKQRSCYV